jgi:hypothetical protein
METLTEFVDELRNQLPIPQFPRQKMVYERPAGTLYNIHKRSIPIGIDKPVVIGLTEDESDLELIRLIKKEETRRKNDDGGVFFYFDMLPVNPRPEETSIYYNDTQVVL